MNGHSRRSESIAYAPAPSTSRWTLNFPGRKFKRRLTDFDVPDSPHSAVHPSRRLTRRIAGLLRSKLLIALFTFSALAYLASRGSLRTAQEEADEELNSTAPTLICNPFDQPGYFQWRQDDPYQGKWMTVQSPEQGGCPDAPDWIAALRNVIEDLGGKPPPPPEPPAADPNFEARQRWQEQEETSEALSWIRNRSVLFLYRLCPISATLRTILVLGDSVDRNSMDHLGHLAWSQVYPTDYRDATFVGKPEGWDIRGVPHVVNMPRLKTQVVSNFFYGVDDEDAFALQADWHAPGKAERRIRELFVPFTAQLKHPPSFIQLHSGMWDLAFFGRHDSVDGVSTNLPFTQEQVAWWLDRMRSIVALLRESYPGVPIWLRTIHRVGTQLGRGSEDYVRGVEQHFKPGHVNFFTDLRCHQLREMQLALARELCLPVNDFGRWWEGLQQYQDKVHPHPLPGGLVYLNPLLHSIWLESRGREKWEDKPCSAGWALPNSTMLS